MSAKRWRGRDQHIRLRQANVYEHSEYPKVALALHAGGACCGFVFTPGRAPAANSRFQEQGPRYTSNDIVRVINDTARAPHRRGLRAGARTVPAHAPPQRALDRTEHGGAGVGRGLLLETE
eukprot:gene14478-biopygen6620